MERTEDVWVWMNVMVSDPKTILLTVVFLAEYGSGLLLLYTSLRPPSPSSHHPFSSTHNDKDSLRSASEYVHQLVWTGMLNVVSALACYFLVMTHLDPQSSWLSYLQWGGATPPMIVVLCLVFGLDHPTTVLLVFLDLVVILLSYLATYYAQSEIKTVTFALSSIHFIAIFGAFLAKRICSTKPNNTSLLGTDSKISIYLLSLILFSWLFQPFSCLLGESGLVYSHYSLDVARGSFSVIAKMLFGLILFHYRAHLTKALGTSLNDPSLPPPPPPPQDSLTLTVTSLPYPQHSPILSPILFV